jgi:hypothetical protein
MVQQFFDSKVEIEIEIEIACGRAGLYNVKQSLWPTYFDSKVEIEIEIACGRGAPPKIHGASRSWK